MATIWNLYKRTVRNGIKRAIKKPITYFYLALILFYAFCIPFSMKVLLEEFRLNTPADMATVFTLVVFWLLPANLISYAKRKGLLYKNADVHFLFSAPISPKMVLLYAHLRNIVVGIVVCFIFLASGIFLFHITAWQVLAYIAVVLIIDNLMEGSLMVMLYGAEWLGEKGRKIVIGVSYLLLAAFVVLAFIAYLQDGLSLESVVKYLHSDGVQCVPIVGWYIGAIHLIFMGPTTVNIVVTVLFVIFSLSVFVIAWKMPCSGDYYEDAMKFAEDYEELRLKKLEGQTARLGKKEKYGKAQVVYKGGGAKAIFYKQLLEYKKSKFFFFDTTTLIMVGLSIFLGYTFGTDPDTESLREFVIPAVMAYIVFCMSSVQGKWGKELKSPYTFLLPDTPFRKLWYATLWEHVKSFICGIAIAVPCGIILKVPVLQIALSVIAYVCLMACKLYNTVMTEALVGRTLGNMGKQLFQMMLQSLVIGVGVMGAVVGMMIGAIETAYIGMIVILVLVTFGLMTAAAGCFQRMESAE